MIAMIVIVYFYSNKEKERMFASAKMSVSQRTMSFECSKMFDREVRKFQGFALNLSIILRNYIIYNRMRPSIMWPWSL